MLRDVFVHNLMNYAYICDYFVINYTKFEPKTVRNKLKSSNLDALRAIDMH
jgi:hypothetical protein